MIKKRYNLNSKCLKLCALFLFPFTLFGGVCLASKNTPSFASERLPGYYSEKVTSLTNSTFEQGATPYAKGPSLSGWNAIETDSHATGMLIDVGKGSNTDENSNETTTFSNNKDEYMLSSNPLSHGEDSRILMINSKEKLSQKNIRSYLGYRSSSVTLEANSNYVLSVSAKAMLNGDDFASGSIYINGLVDKDGEDIVLGYENFENQTWKEYYFFISTGNSSQTITVDLYLGSANGVRSEGAVFFDNVNITRYSQNQFIELSKDYGYVNKDNTFIEYADNASWENGELKTIFLIDKLQPDFYIVEGTENMNFDFEDEIPQNSDTLGEHWKIIPGARSNASARIMDIRNMQNSDFSNLTGFDNVGDDFSFNNSQALVLYTNSNQYSSNGYIGVRSEDINIDAHSIYKVSLKMKIAGREEGSFYLQVSENENIYSAYPTILSNDETAKNYYALQSAKTSGITANVTDAWSNDYQTVELYIKGHNMFNTSVNLELWLGDSATPANGCVIIDNIKVERTAYSSFSGASNQLELKWKDSETETITNSSFNKTENANEDGKFPATASGWTVNKEDEDKNESGVIYLADKATYDRLYEGKYQWAGINPNKTNNPNNVYMMFNSKNSYQSILSTASTISANSYYKLSFEYYNQIYSNLNPSQINVEVVDENGIVLFSKNGLQSLDNWSNMEIYFHTAETVSHSIQVKISLGDEDEKVGGIVYLDNFSLVADQAYSEIFDNMANKVELGNYYLNLESGEFSGIKESPAYSLVVDEVYDPNYTTNNSGNFGGLVYGKNNNYGITNDSNLLVITNVVASSTTIQSNYSLSLNADSYYELSFDLATFFGDKAGNTNKDHKKCKYGFKVTLDGYEAISELVGQNELKTYKIYYKSTSESSTPKISFSLVSDCDNSIGSAIITNLNFTATDEYTYNNLSVQPGYKSSIFTATKSDVVDDDNNDGDNDDSDSSTESNSSSTWLLIPSIIMGVALIVAIIGIAMRKVKIKKIERIRKETYDRKMSINHEMILAEAQKKRDSEVSDLLQAKARLTEERQILEQEHKEYVKEQRQTSGGKLSRAVESEFKKYNANISRIDEKINILKEKIDYCMSPDYLISLQRKLVIEEEERQTAEKRERKALAKQMEKENKKDN